MKQRTRFSGLLAILCLLAFTAAGQSYTIHFIKGTERINHQRLQTANNLEELITLLSDCSHQLSTGEYTVSLTALQSVSKRYDSAARELAMRQATFFAGVSDGKLLPGRSPTCLNSMSMLPYRSG